MFTGLVEEMGVVQGLKKNSQGIELKIKCSAVVQGGKLGDSIATNGVCLTAVQIGKDYFVADVMNESLSRSGIKNLKVGSKVNLEKSLTLNTPLGGHLVTGDVECQGEIINIKNDGFAKIYKIKIPKEYMKYVVEKGRVAIDGASLTISLVGKEDFCVSIIPHTQKMIILGGNRVGDLVNIETDLIGKFVEKSMLSDDTNNKNLNGNSTKKSGLTKKLLLENGFM